MMTKVWTHPVWDPSYEKRVERQDYSRTEIENMRSDVKALLDEGKNDLEVMHLMHLHHDVHMSTDRIERYNKIWVLGPIPKAKRSKAPENWKEIKNAVEECKLKNLTRLQIALLMFERHHFMADHKFYRSLLNQKSMQDVGDEEQQHSHQRQPRRPHSPDCEASLRPSKRHNSVSVTEPISRTIATASDCATCDGDNRSEMRQQQYEDVVSDEDQITGQEDQIHHHRNSSGWSYVRSSQSDIQYAMSDTTFSNVSHSLATRYSDQNSNLYAVNDKWPMYETEHMVPNATPSDLGELLSLNQTYGSHSFPWSRSTKGGSLPESQPTTIQADFGARAIMNNGSDQIQPAKDKVNSMLGEQELQLKKFITEYMSSIAPCTDSSKDMAGSDPISINELDGLPWKFYATSYNGFQDTFTADLRRRHRGNQLLIKAQLLFTQACQRPCRRLLPCLFFYYFVACANVNPSNHIPVTKSLFELAKNMITLGPMHSLTRILRILSTAPSFSREARSRIAQHIVTSLQDCWNNDYDATYEAHELLVIMRMEEGDFPGAHECCNVMIEQPKIDIAYILRARRFRGRIFFRSKDWYNARKVFENIRFIWEETGRLAMISKEYMVWEDLAKLEEAESHHERAKKYWSEAKVLSDRSYWENRSNSDRIIAAGRLDEDFANLSI